MRTEAKITLRRFADKVGISAAHQSDIELDRRRPSPELLLRIANALRHVGGTPEHLDQLNTRVDPETQEWVAKTPGARQLLRVARQSGRDPKELVAELERYLRERT